jgi:chemotaxis methyl-accepting protein methylase
VSTAEIRSLLTQRIGVRWNEDRLRDLEQFLARGVDPADANALADFMNGETYFFRYPLYLAVLQARLDRHSADRPFRVWCAACSSGEEVYSVAFTLLDRAGETGRQVEIVGSDVRARAIASARSAIYGQWSFRNVPRADRSRHFEPLAGSTWRVKEPYRSAPRFVVRNLLDAVDDVAYDAILLCNATLYMEPQAAQRVYERVAACLRPEGLLLLAPTDPPPGPAWQQADEYGGWSIFRRGAPRPAPPPSPSPSPSPSPAPAPAQAVYAAAIPPAAPRPRRPPVPAPAPVPPPVRETLSAVGAPADALWTAWAEGALTSAEDELRRRIFLEPESPLWRFLNGVVLWEQGWLRRAGKEIERAARLAAGQADGVSIAGLCSAAELRGMIEFWRARHG